MTAAVPGPRQSCACGHPFENHWRTGKRLCMACPDGQCADFTAAATVPGPRFRDQQQLRIVPVTFADACAFVAMWHRHHAEPRGHKFSIGVADDQDRLVGVAIVGRPVARLYDDGMTLEVNRTATDGTPNANSALYGAAWRAARALGFRRLITYTQDGESGASLRGAGWRVIAERRPRPGWNMPSRPRDDRGVDRMPRTLWEAS